MLYVHIEENGIERKVQAGSTSAAEAFVRRESKNAGVEPKVAAILAAAAARCGRVISLASDRVKIAVL